MADEQTPVPARSRLLVIDDDQVQRTIISRIGDQVGFDVEAAATFETASDLLRSHAFDGVTLDLGLGDRSGALLLPVIAQVETRVPVLVISGASAQILEATSVMSHALQIDAEILAKPLDLPRLREALTRIRQAAAPRGVRKSA